MKTENIFEYATKHKIRFPFKGSISVEDLWDLSVTDLDKVFKILNTQVKQLQEESLLNIKTKENEEIEIKIAIVKHIVSVKLAEKEEKEKASARKAQKQKIMSIIEEKQDEVLKNTSIEDLKKMLEALKD